MDLFLLLYLPEHCFGNSCYRCVFTYTSHPTEYLQVKQTRYNDNVYKTVDSKH